MFERCDIQAHSILLRGFFDLYEWRRQQGYEVSRLRCPSGAGTSSAKAAGVALHIVESSREPGALCLVCCTSSSAASSSLLSAESLRLQTEGVASPPSKASACRVTLIRRVLMQAWQGRLWCPAGVRKRQPRSRRRSAHRRGASFPAAGV